MAVPEWAIISSHVATSCCVELTTAAGIRLHREAVPAAVILRSNYIIAITAYFALNDGVLHRLHHRRCCRRRKDAHPMTIRLQNKDGRPKVQDPVDRRTAGAQANKPDEVPACNPDASFLAH